MKASRRIKKINELLLEKINFKDNYWIHMYDDGFVVNGKHFEKISDAFKYINALTDLDPIKRKTTITLFNCEIDKEYDFENDKWFKIKTIQDDE